MMCAKITSPPRQIARTRPHIVVFTGDVIDSRAFPPDSPRDCWKATFRAAIAPVVAHGIPWTFVPGNHDHEEGCPYKREDMLQVYSGEFPLCLSEGAASFNHSLTVGPGPFADASNTLRLWLFDTGGNNPNPKIQCGHSAHQQSLHPLFSMARASNAPIIFPAICNHS